MVRRIRPPRSTSPARARAWRLSRLHAGTGKPMTRRELATYLGVGLRSIERYESATEYDEVPGWLSRLVAADHVPPGYYRRGGA